MSIVEIHSLRMTSPMIANIPLALAEVLQPSELGALVDEAQRRQVSTDELIVLALREFAAARQRVPTMSLPECSAASAA